MKNNRRKKRKMQYGKNAATKIAAEKIAGAKKLGHDPEKHCPGYVRMVRQKNMSEADFWLSFHFPRFSLEKAREIENCQEGLAPPQPTSGFDLLRYQEQSQCSLLSDHT